MGLLDGNLRMMQRWWLILFADSSSYLFKYICLAQVVVYIVS